MGADADSSRDAARREGALGARVVTSVTAVIPCFNYGRFLGEAIESALAQTVPFTRILVADDGSTDETAEVAARYADRVDYVHSTNVGQTRIRNAGLQQVDTEYVVFLDADDVLAPTFLEACIAALATADPRADFAYTQYRRFGDLSGNIDTESDFPEWSVERLKSQNFVTITTLMPTALLRKHPFNTRLRRGYADWDLYLTLAGRGYRGVLVDEALLLYRRHESSLQWHYSHMLATKERLRAYLALRHWKLYGAAESARRAAKHLIRWAELRARATVQELRRRT